MTDRSCRIAISPRGELVSLGGDEFVRLWKPAARARRERRI